MVSTPSLSGIRTSGTNTSTGLLLQRGNRFNAVRRGEDSETLLSKIDRIDLKKIRVVVSDQYAGHENDTPETGYYFAQVSRNVMVRLKTGRAGELSLASRVK